MIRFTAAFFPRWRADLEQRYLRTFELPADRKVKALSRGMRTKLALLLALCRGAELLILDEPTSGLDPAMTEEVLQALVGARRERGDDGVLLVAPDRRSRSDRRPRRDHRSRPRRGRRRARRSARAATAASSSCSTATRRSRRSARRASSACGARAACSRCCRAPAPSGSSTRRARCNPVSVDVVPVTLKEIFLETVAAED